jgi:hypothetical protein
MGRKYSAENGALRARKAILRAIKAVKNIRPKDLESLGAGVDCEAFATAKDVLMSILVDSSNPSPTSPENSPTLV